LLVVGDLIQQRREGHKFDVNRLELIYILMEKIEKMFEQQWFGKIKTDISIKGFDY